MWVVGLFCLGLWPPTAGPVGIGVGSFAMLIVQYQDFCSEANLATGSGLMASRRPTVFARPSERPCRNGGWEDNVIILMGCR